MVEFVDHRNNSSRDRGPSGAKPRMQAKPGWADGLRKLYDDVVSEPLPESFEDLLNKLDQAGNDRP